MISLHKDECLFIKRLQIGVKNVAMIKCPECGKEISNRAKMCPICGFPIENEFYGGIVKIKLPRTQEIADGFVGLLISKDVSIYSKGKVIWSGQQGQTASFSIDEPIMISIDLGWWGNVVSGWVEPQHKYELIQDYGIHMKATFRLSEVDIIDSGR